MHRYFAIYKPYDMLSQFVSPHPKRLLGSIDFDFPPGTQAVGRLDGHSEGLLLLTTDGSLTRRLLHPAKKHFRRYLVLVDRTVDLKSLQMLRDGIDILVKGKGLYRTKPCDVEIVESPVVAERDPPYTIYRDFTWLEFTLQEGKNRQIRKMCSEIRHKCNRLIRTSIEDLTIEGMLPGEVKEFSQEEYFRLLRL